jgi:hypothetical protein
LWKTFCFEESTLETSRSAREQRLYHDSWTTGFPFKIGLHHPTCLTASTYETYKAEKAQTYYKGSSNPIVHQNRKVAHWDPSYKDEQVDWYQEYIQRKESSPISLSWLERPVGGDGYDKFPLDVRGIGYLDDGTVVGPTEDGDVCVWSLGDSNHQKYGKLVGQSSPSILSVTGESSTARKSRAKMTSTGVVECVSVDNVRRRAYFAVQSGLDEVDLQTLQVVSHRRFPFSISALSEVSYPQPLTVGTNLSLHLHDPRVHYGTSTIPEGAGDDIVEKVATFPDRYEHLRNNSSDNINGYAPLFQPGPLSILHVPSTGSQSDNSGDIYVAGRFPSILKYDRRFWPKLHRNIHSGGIGSLCSLTSIPYSYAAYEQDTLRFENTTIDDVMAAKSRPGVTLVACGEYRGKGSLEHYEVPVPSHEPNDETPSPFVRASFQNRHNVSSSKLLSVTNHGTRLVFSDGDGGLKWMERDGATTVRSWNINEHQRMHGSLVPEESRMFHHEDSDIANSEVIRKIITTHGPISSSYSNAADSGNLLFWTGERIGFLNFSSNPAVKADEDKAEPVSGAEAMKRREEAVYGETMRRALERQADEVRFVVGLGLGARPPM